LIACAHFWESTKRAISSLRHRSIMPSLRFAVPFAGSSLALALFFCLFQIADASVGVTINGNAVDVEPAPITQAGRVFVPLRGVFEQLGASVVYDAGHINATGNGRNISLQIGSTQATVDGQPQTIDVAPFIIGASTYVPLRFISESLGASVDWDDADSIVAITMNGAPQGGQDENVMSDSDEYADSAPPPIPDYDQPAVPEPNEIWQPGYWAWGDNGYYWVPGTWVEPPQSGYLWTPGYWQASNNHYAWNPGYWALAVGFYGGVNYGAGYYGNGYVGGRWSNNTFRYNTSVTHVNTNVVRNVYVDHSVVVNNSTRVSYNGGPHGVQARPNAQQVAVSHGHHVGMTSVQQQHVQTAAHDPRLLATVNHNQPPVLAVARPLSTANRPAGYTPAAPAAHAAPAYHAAPAAAPAYHAAPAARPAPAERPAAAAPAYHPAPAAAPAYRPAPAAAPAYHAAPAARPAPAYHPAAAPAAPPAAHLAPAPPAERAAPAEHVPRAGVPPAAHRPAPKDAATKQP
jgi:hypothetical protein